MTMKLRQLFRQINIRSIYQSVLWFLVVDIVSFASVGVNANEACGPLLNHYGPFDYWIDKPKLPIVEGAHFTREVEYLKVRKTGPFGGDIGYTLHAFPNHPRALMAMVRLGESERVSRPNGARYTVECYLERAVRFRPNDGMARSIYGIYLAKQKKNKEALVQLEAAEQAVGDNANLHYNLGLVYLDIGKYEQALQHAHKAYKLGFELPGLRNRLQKSGHWREMSAVPVDAATEPSPEVATDSTPSASAMQ